MILHRGVLKDIKAYVLYEGPVTAPIEQGQQIGVLRIEPASGDAREYPLFAGKAVKGLGPLGKIALAAKTLLARPEHVDPTRTETGEAAPEPSKP